MNQENEIEVLGFWWFLGHSEEKFPGQLKFKPNEGITLQIFLESNYELFRNQYKKYEIIYGCAGNQIYTLVSCFQIGHSANSASNIFYHTFDADLLVSHNIKYFESINDFQFCRLITKMDNTLKFFETTDSYTHSQEITEESTIHFIEETPQQIEFDVDDNLRGIIYIGSGNSISRREKTFNIKGEVSFSIESKNNSLIHLKTLEKEMDNLRIFFSIVMQGVCIYDEIETSTPDLPYNFHLYKQDTYEEASKRFMMFDLKTVQNKISDILKNWFQLCKAIPEAINLFYNVYTSTKFYEYHFRDTYVALEGLFQWKKSCDTDGKNVITILLNDILKSDDKRNNIPSFVKIVDGFPKWSVIARNNRHFQTHLNKEKYANDIVANTELLRIMRKMQAIFLFYILEELGLSDTEIERSFRKTGTHFSPFLL
jgi:ApeA N-terminal domain 1